MNLLSKDPKYFIYNIEIIMPGKCLVRGADGTYTVCSVNVEIKDVLKIIQVTDKKIIVLTRRRNKKNLYIDEIYMEGFYDSI